MPNTPDRHPPLPLKAAGEAVALVLVAAAPWPFAAVPPFWEFAVTAGVAVVVLLWAADAARTGRLALRPDGITLSLVGLILLALVQLVPLPESVVGVVSPAAAEVHRTFRPAIAELLPGEPGPAEPRPTWLPVALDPYMAKVFVAQALAALLLYAAVRNWIASRESFRRLAWVAAGNGFVLALVALAQFATSPRNVVLWQFPTEGAVFGPFVCRNHFPDYANFCLGLAAGLLAKPTEREHPARQNSLPQTDSPLTRALDAMSSVVQSPRAFVLVILLGTMAASVPLSLSRGGVLATVIAGAATAALVAKLRGRLAVGGGVAGAAVVALGTAAFFAWGAVETRLVGAWAGLTHDSRTVIWKDALAMTPRFLVTGAGAGSFARAEPLGRTELNSTVINESAHNEYLEALFEGGVIRLALTAVLAFVAVRGAARAAARLKGRSTGPLAVGAFFGLLALAVHSGADFGVRIPAVAVLAAVVAAQAAAAAADEGYEKVLRLRGGKVPTTIDVDTPAIRGGAVFLAATVLVVVAAVAAWAAYHRGRADELRKQADAAATSGDPNRYAVRVGIQAARVGHTPDDPAALHDFAVAHFEAAAASTRTLGAAVAGAVLVGVPMNDAIPPDVARAHVYPGLAAARAARAAGPLHSPAHVRLGQFNDYFAAAEPPGAHFDRAKKLLFADADVWFGSGVAAARRGDLPAARDAWRRAAALSAAHVPAVVRAAGMVPGFDPVDLIPPDPPSALAAADFLYPDRLAHRAERRRVFAASAALDPMTLKLHGAMALAAIFAELDRPADAEAAWKRAVELNGDAREPRDGLARFLETEERYADALPHFDLLRQKYPGRIDLKDRIDAARHALKLAAAIAGDK